MTPSFVAATETKFASEMGTAYPTIELYYSNIPVPDELTAYACIHIIAGDTMQKCISEDSGSRNVGIIQIDIYTPKDEGAGEARGIAHTIGKAFRRWTTSTAEGRLQFKEPQVQDRGEVRGRHKHMVTVPYYYDFVPA